MEVDKQLYEEIKAYCSLNGLKPREFTNSLLRKAFIEEKFGKTPPFFKQPAMENAEISAMNNEQQKDAEKSGEKSENTAETPTESRHDVEKSGEKGENAEKNSVFPDKNETITPEPIVLEKTVPENEEKKDVKKQTIKKRKL